MENDTTSFEIPNGSIDAYMKKWKALGIDDVEITFYDKGYTKLEKGIKNMQFMAFVFGIAGIILGITLLIFYSRTFIGGQTERIAVERCMGMTGVECRRSLLTGAMLVLFLGSMAGCITGTISAKNMTAYDMEMEYYDTSFSGGVNISMEEMQNLEPAGSCVWLIGIVCEIVILAVGYGILHRDINVLLKKEPLYLLEEIHTAL